MKKEWKKKQLMKNNGIFAFWRQSPVAMRTEG